MLEARKNLDKMRSGGDLKASVGYGVTQNPEVAAKNQANARKFGLPLDVVEQQSEEVDQAARRKEIIEKLQGSPILKEMMKDARFAAVANDDLEELGRVESSTGVGEYLEGIGTEFAIGSALAVEGIKAQWWDLVGGIQEIVNPDPEVMEEIRRKQLKSITDFQIGEDIREEARPDFKTKEAGAFYSGVASFARQTPGLLMGLVGGPAAGLTYMGIMTEAEAYLKYRERGGTRGEALTGAMAEGAIEVATELLPMTYFVNMFGKAGFAQFIGGILAREMPTEVVATVGQEFVDTVVANPDKTLQDYRDELPANIYHTLIATLAHAGLAGTLNIPAKLAADRYGGGIDRAQRAIDEADRLNKQVTHASASKLRTRDPVQFKNFFERTLGAENAVYMAPEDAQAFFQSHPEIMDTLPEDTGGLSNLLHRLSRGDRGHPSE
jgi:hypothetical protein